MGCGKPQAHRIVRAVKVATDAVRFADHILRALLLAIVWQPHGRRSLILSLSKAGQL